MSETIRKLQKRRVVPVELGSGETVHVKPLSQADWLVVNAIADYDGKSFLIVAMSLVDPDGTPVITRGEMSLDDFAKHAESELKDVDLYTLKEIVERAAFPAPPVKAIAKN